MSNINSIQKVSFHNLASETFRPQLVSASFQCHVILRDEPMENNLANAVFLWL